MTTDFVKTSSATDDSHHAHAIHQRVPSSNSSFNTATSQDDCQTTATTTTQNPAATQNVGVLQKFKRTLTNFNKPQSGATAAATTTDSSSTFQVTDTEMQSQDVTDACNKYRFGPLVWRTSKERRKTKYNRRDKCNSGDSGIQIELENDEQFARALAANGGVGGGGAMNSTGSHGLFNRKQEGMVSRKLL